MNKYNFCLFFTFSYFSTIYSPLHSSNFFPLYISSNPFLPPSLHSDTFPPFLSLPLLSSYLLTFPPLCPSFHLFTPTLHSHPRTTSIVTQQQRQHIQQNIIREQMSGYKQLRSQHKRQLHQVLLLLYLRYFCCCICDVVVVVLTLLLLCCIRCCCCCVGAIVFFVVLVLLVLWCFCWFGGVFADFVLLVL